MSVVSDDLYIQYNTKPFVSVRQDSIQSLLFVSIKRDVAQYGERTLSLGLGEKPIDRDFYGLHSMGGAEKITLAYFFLYRTISCQVQNDIDTIC